ncbi:PREDICTED: nose resistant to fluoxetine protein 6-like [Eufriesea mexicana]|uniref:nose resistant to fluoxetine protein 6-like n=1 Tax=Eufriesea mexicana TaxID=516756 RepID=UPI00083C1FFF|nr:PREDICTED: nose resistant to fluoxetine protein 6-like [Eufriesea mexicana]
MGFSDFHRMFYTSNGSPGCSISFFGFSFLLLISVGSVKLMRTSTDKPETMLLDFLSKPFAPSDGVSAECLRDSAFYLRELDQYTPWALQMYDASVKIPPGVITGNYQQLGNYDECLQVKSGHGFTGKACSATVNFEIAEDNGKPRQPDMGDLLLNIAIASGHTKWKAGRSVNYEWMWCIPSSCNDTEIQEALELGLDPLKVEDRVDMVINVSCRTAETDRLVFDVTDWVYISILAIFVVIIIASTSYDIAKQGHLSTLNRKDRKHLLLTSFSVYTNGKNLLRTDRHRESIKCLDGLRYISICWIIYGHTHYTEMVGVKMNLSDIPQMHINWANMFVLNANIITDTFFLISGVLMAYTALIKNEKSSRGHFDVVGLYLHRYLRLTPAYAMMIGFYATLLYKVSSGPHWDQWVGANRDYCRENWWINLLYLNNYIHLPRICMSQSWYLATDMQLVWLSPIFLYPMLKFTREIFFWLIFVLGLIASVLIPFLITFSLRLEGTMLYYKDNTDVANVYIHIYTRVYSRYGSYIIGLALGYFLYKNRSRVLKIRRIYLVLGWLVAAVSGIFIFVCPRWMYFDDYSYDKLEASFYAGFHRQIFALSVSWLIFCCVHGYGGFVSQFLSWKGWVPFSKLTYSAYLCHYVFLLTEAGSVRTTGIISSMAILRSFFSNLCLTMLLSALWTLCFEMPFMTLDRAFVSQRKGQSKLSSKPNQGKIFGSVDSSKEIYRSTEESTATLSQSCENTFNRKCSKDNMYDVDLKSEDRDDKCPFIFVIGSNSNDSWVQGRNIHQNSGFDQDSDELFKSRTENRIDRVNKSIVNANLTRKEGSRNLDQVNGS